MKPFEEYEDGEWVTYVNVKSPWHLMQFQAYKSQWTENAFRLKYGTREVIADISEIEPIKNTNSLLTEAYDYTNSSLQRYSEQGFKKEDIERYSQVQD